MSGGARLIPYDATRASLYRPGRADDFFSRPGPWSVAGLCAELSRLSYCDDAVRRRRSLARAGLDEHSFLATAGTEVLVATDPARVFVAFRGTDDPKALVADLKVPPVPWETAGRVHVGFRDYLMQVKEPLAGILEGLPGRALVLTGHSLGAAAATLALSLWPNGALHAFGSPRVGDAAFAATLPADRATRFVNCCDLVCRIPPSSLGYGHVGRRSYIDRNGLLGGEGAEDEPEADQALGRKAYFAKYAWAFWRNVLLRDFADHSPVNYVTALHAAAAGPSNTP